MLWPPTMFEPTNSTKMATKIQIKGPARIFLKFMIEAMPHTFLVKRA
jgi:hypothetical protein